MTSYCTVLKCASSLLIASCIFASCSCPKQLNQEAYAPDGTVKALEPNSTYKDNAIVINTNFAVPIVRFNQHKDPNLTSDHSMGSVALFNSIGAGIGIYSGRLTRVTDNHSSIISSDFDNSFGLQLGFLFAANTEDDNRQDIFALTSELNILNFQLGAGYEFGHVVANQKRVFFTVAYGISLSKLSRGGVFVVKHLKNRHKSYFPY